MEEMYFTKETCADIEHEVMLDFKDAIKEINFKKYNPYSGDFMKALFLGQMWDLLCKMNTACNCEVKHHEDEMFEDVLEELEGAEKYTEMFNTSGDSIYRELAKDELKHASILINKYNGMTTDEKEIQKLREMTNRHNELLSMLESKIGYSQITV